KTSATSKATARKRKEPADERDGKRQAALQVSFEFEPVLGFPLSFVGVGVVGSGRLPDPLLLDAVRLKLSFGF
ncbi:hypothetical protein B296_00021004, partial [Ensete ventricosum]